MGPTICAERLTENAFIKSSNVKDCVHPGNTRNIPVGQIKTYVIPRRAMVGRCKNTSIPKTSAAGYWTSLRTLRRRVLNRFQKVPSRMKNPSSALQSMNPTCWGAWRATLRQNWHSHSSDRCRKSGESIRAVPGDCGNGVRWESARRIRRIADF